jgi:hypothetical protein
MHLMGKLSSELAFIGWWGCLMIVEISQKRRMQSWS